MIKYSNIMKNATNIILLQQHMIKIKYRCNCPPIKVIFVSSLKKRINVFFNISCTPVQLTNINHSILIRAKVCGPKFASSTF